ncbi:hypothetical protein BKH46_08320 [Helicobacter sp. 12S02634-8]|uniref:hypothetical protein n=1 Tax=Helicobacter sp. 12S02634-8 TaxID=1476199 RepID=UPI000BA72607|nr:hypothetical protein [Helicobacter sp. 12S02634-8]PAF46235.1 hypothetical protein BKH46_08320 [Helicobacter sp. 12S02634-8]
MTAIINNTNTSLFSFCNIPTPFKEVERTTKAIFRKAVVELKRHPRKDGVWRVCQIEEGEENYYVDHRSYQEALEDFEFWSKTIESKDVNLKLISEFEIRS